MNVGLTGAFLCAKHYGHEISQNPAGGAIINVSSDLGLIAPDQRLYSKGGLSSDNPVKTSYILGCQDGPDWTYPLPRDLLGRTECEV